MKTTKIILSVLLFACIQSTLLAQSKTQPVLSNTVEKKLTRSEFQEAKDLYLKMIKSEIYIQMNKKFKIVFEHLNGLKQPEPERLEDMKSEKDLESFYADWLKKNIKKTKFKSVEQGVSAIMDGFHLNKKLVQDNINLFKLMSKGNKEQILEIIQVENPYDKLYELTKQ
jgi:hypothetical protein